jgi:hypothetical protein
VAFDGGAREPAVTGKIKSVLANSLRCRILIAYDQ